MKLNTYQKFLSIYMAFLIVFWIILFTLGLRSGFWNYLFSFAFSLIPLIGGMIGMFFAKSWGWLKSSVGRTVFFISIGSFSWGAGSMIWSFYNFFLNVAAPYPSFADIGFVLAIPFWIIGILSLARATGARSGFHQHKGKLLFFLLPIFALVISYYLLIVVARDGILIGSIEGYLKLFLDLAYPIGDVVILTITLILFGLSTKYLGGIYKLPVRILFLGFVLMYFADFVFSYTTTTETFYNGSFGDLLFAVALFVIMLGTFGLN